MDPLETRPRSVALVALGPSKTDYLHAIGVKKDFLHVDEVWDINSLAGTFICDKHFVMDDLKYVQSKYPGWANKLKTLKEPIITCRQYDEFPTSVAYPINAVLEKFQDDWITNSVAYAIAYATFIEVEELYLFGCDFFYPGSNAVEPGADCCAYWLGRARERGIRYRIPNTSTLLDSHIAKAQDNGPLKRPLYGYDYNPGRMMEKVSRGTASPEETLLAQKTPTLTAAPTQEGKDAA